MLPSQAHPGPSSPRSLRQIDTTSHSISSLNLAQLPSRTSNTHTGGAKIRIPMSQEGDPGPPGTGKTGIIAAPADAGDMDKVAHSVLDDLLYNIMHELLLETHRNEKMARAATAAIKIEKLAADAADGSIPGSKPDVRIETDAAIYEDGRVMLKGNPLKTTKEILCPRCHLPRLLHPTDGKGAQKADPSVIYCKKHPYIEKPGFDIYGQTWLQPGPGRGKKKKDKDAKADANNESPAPAEEKGTSSKDRPPNVLTFPSATCVKCKRCILVTRLNNHMGSCIGNSGRNASRAAAQKISSGGSNAGSQNNDGTPPETGAPAGSRKGTPLPLPLPLPTSQGASPKKRSSDEIEDDAAEEDAEDVAQPKKKKLKPTPTAAVVAKKKATPKPKAAVLKKDVAKVAKGKPGAARLVEQKMDLADEDGDDEKNSDEDDAKDKDNDVESGSGEEEEEEAVVNEPVKTPRTRATPKPTAKKTAAAAAKTVPKANPKKAKAQAVLPPILPPPPATTRKAASNKAAASAAASAKKAKANKKPAPPPSPAPAPKKAKRRVLRDDPQSDSSGSLSPPP